MRKIFLGVLLVISLVLLPNSVCASDITSDLDVSNSLGNHITFEKSYDSQNDVNNVHTILTVNESVLNTVLSQKPGVGGYLGVFYVGVIPNKYKGMAQHKQVNNYYATGSDVSAIKSDLAKLIQNKDIDYTGDPTTWVYGVGIEHYKDGKWSSAVARGTGTTSNGDYLVSVLGLSSIDELVYGENYRLIMYENLDWYIQYQEVGNEANTEYVRVSYEIKFPVSAKAENGVVAYYPTLEEALESGSKNIVVNEDLVTSQDITIPEDVEVTVSENVTIELTSDAKLTNKGNLVNNGDIILQDTSSIENSGVVENNGSITGNKNYYTVTGSNEFSISSSLVEEGELVSVTVADKDGFKIKSVKAVYGSNQTVKVTEQKGTYSFIMPQGNVTLSVEYEAITDDSKTDATVKDEENPNTFDGVLGYGILGLVSLLGLFGTGIYLNKKCVKSL